MGWDRFSALSDALLKIEVPCLIGVIPDCRDHKLWRFPPRRDFWDVIRDLKSSGWTIAQHGYTHVYDRVSRDVIGIMRKSEFAGHDFETQVSRLASGARVLSNEGLATDIFMAPSHAFDRLTIKALRQTGFKFVTDGAALWPYEEHGVIFIPQIFPHPRHFGAGIYTLCWHLDTIDESTFRGLLRFVESNTHRIIGFKDAVKYTRNGVIGYASRRLMRAFEYSRYTVSMRRQGKTFL